MKLEVGMYIRTKDGLIAKIQSINEYAIALKNTYCERRENKYFTFPNEEEIYEIIKSSYKIIELLEEGDYVNGWEVYEIQTTDNDEERTFVSVDECYDNYCGFIYEKDIKSIVAKEQFKSVEYIVGDTQ